MDDRRRGPTIAPQSRARRRALARRRRVTALAILALIVGGAVTAALVGDPGRGRHPRRDLIASLRPTAIGHARLRADGSTPQSLLGREDRAIDRLLSRQPFITTGGSERREIALTFDDGPGPYTPRLLDELQRLHVPATFFEIGFMFRWFHASVTRELATGDVIGDHTETHPMMAALSPSAQQAQILEQTQWVRKYGGPLPRLWRPPYGSYDSATLRILHRLRMLMVLWTVDTQDYRQPGVAAIVQRALEGARPGAIILMHDAGGTRTQTIAALPIIVHALRQRGYRLVTIPTLILDDPPTSRQHVPTGLADG